jgi:glycosidase
VLDLVAPDAILLTETNVPHEENISYFGDYDEAHMVYNFSLPPLLLYSLLREDASFLRDWARSLPDLSPEQAFFNFTASHDGIGVRPLQGLLPDEEIAWLADSVRARNGRVSMKANSDGSKSPYELNITYRDALRVEEDLEASLARFLTSQAIVLAFKGVPALYIHSVLGTENDLEGVERSGQNRSINRHKWESSELESLLAEPGTAQSRIFRKLSQWIQTRNQHPAFHPGAKMEVMDFGSGLFAFLRTSRTGVEKILCLFNLTGEPQTVPWVDCFPGLKTRDRVRELLARGPVRPKKDQFVLKPFHSAWLMIKGSGETERAAPRAARKKKA